MENFKKEKSNVIILIRNLKKRKLFSFNKKYVYRNNKKPLRERSGFSQKKITSLDFYNDY
jgi:hypothetical protein